MAATSSPSTVVIAAALSGPLRLSTCLPLRVVPEDEVLGTTRKGKQVLNLKGPDKAAAMTTVDGELVAAIGGNRKMVIFALDQVPEMTRGRGVRLQRYKEKGLSDVTTFKADDGLSWIDGAGRTQTLSMKELKDWRGNRDNVLEDRFLEPAGAKAAAGARFSDRDVKHRERRLVGACHGNGNFRRGIRSRRHE